MTETPGPGRGRSYEPLITSGTPEPDWAALADRHEQDVRRRKQIRVAAASVGSVAAVVGILATVLGLSGRGHPSAAGAGTPAATASAMPDTDLSSSFASSAASASAPIGGAPPSAGPSSPGGTVPSGGAGQPVATWPGVPPAAGTSPAPQQPPAANPTTHGASTPAPPPTAANPYTPGQLCGSGYGVIDSHNLGAATVYLLYNGGNGNNCVVTLVDHPSGSVAMNATLAVKGGSSKSDPGNFEDYAGPVTEHAVHTCVDWGGSYQSSSWTSGWSHCT